ncbi:hypothetical protein L1785_12750 [Antribacter sp. KLBMP9083]|uniref:Uncharacterized protein n=1 Tax=Antribacter soli TaxID=2910976 RepID=A0AA41QEU8_9MICO|nr:hypothetical protein [Antribacter soli]MCF4121852.1 hypothetical protein [Antribacter soli]
MTGHAGPRDGAVGDGWAESLLQVTSVRVPTGSHGGRRPRDVSRDDNALLTAPPRRSWRFGLTAVVAGAALVVMSGAWALAPVTIESVPLTCLVTSAGDGPARYAADVTWVDHGRELLGVPLPDLRSYADVAWATAAHGGLLGGAGRPASGTVHVQFVDGQGSPYPSATRTVSDGVVVASRGDLGDATDAPEGGLRVPPPRPLRADEAGAWHLETTLSVDGAIVAGCVATVP